MGACVGKLMMHEVNGLPKGEGAREDKTSEFQIRSTIRAPDLIIHILMTVSMLMKGR